MKLTESEAAAYHRDGFVICRWPLFDSRRLEVLRSIAREYVAEAEAGRRPADLNQPHFTDPRLFNFALDPEVLDLAERLLGYDLLLWSTQFFCKEPFVGASVPWHADAHYWTNFIDPVQVLSVYCALDEQSMGNGCLRVLRGSHLTRDAFSYGRTAPDANPFFPEGVEATDLDPAQIAAAELKPGEFILFDGWLLHGSDANTSPRMRYSFTMRYAPTDCRVDSISVQPVRRGIRAAAGFLRRMLFGHDIYRHRVYLARGCDRAGNRYHPLPAWKSE